MLMFSFVSEIIVNNMQSEAPVSQVVQQAEKQQHPGVYYASAEEETGASEAPRQSKGAIYVGSGSTFTFSSGTIKGHSATYGGAVYVASGGVFTMTGGTIEDNEAEYGGAIYVESGGVCNLYSGLIQGNLSDQGKSVYAEHDGHVNYSEQTDAEPCQDLPIEYQQVEYIESNGTQWISTGVQATGDIDVEVKFNLSVLNGVVFGAYSNSIGNPTFSYFASVNGASSRYDYKNTSTLYGPQLNIDTWYTVKSGKNGFYLNSNLLGTATYSSFAAGQLFLFRRNGGTDFYMSGKMAYCKIWDNGILVRNFISCYRKTDDVIGMYDTINGVFYTKAGGETFLKGRNVYEPIEIIDSISRLYQEVEYIESNGTQYIDTGITCKTGLTIQIAFKNLVTNVSDIFGNFVSEDNSFRLFTYSNDCYLDYGSGCNTDNRHIFTKTSFNIKLNFEIGNGYVKDLSTNTDLLTFEKENFVKDYNLLICPSLAGGYTCNQIYYVKIYDNNILVRDFIPCYRKSDNEVGLYDLVNHVFYTNAGTGAFGQGPIVN